ncbi:WD40 repeat domain-containing serine/threonine protein kinase [Nocardiopsis ganjiahuensis]|uniref:WD40 repeat domain-containing serine/threonine protein kinase n=1 Tax=Nocardiopsis ganjiahuensis TaxID=239984 RepID=UPI0003489CE5|nr:WD40 repeat domain-containing serine/threonine protein kinase [Nocardiopsis ganjiahuensis]
MEPLHPDDPRELGPFRLLRRVGEGGMGVVFLAVSGDGSGNGTGDDLAAVKAVRSEYSGDREFRARFASEVELARRVRGPYTARVLDADTDGTRPWLATEYVPGPSLHQAVRDSGPFPESSLRVLAAGLAEALAAIHTVGLVHRDLKPSNVLLSPRGPQVIDFGIARAADTTQLTRTGQALGTPAYMSPEQAVGRVVDPRSDLFSFGGVLLFSATGHQPFGTGNAHALLYRVVNEEPDLNGVPEALRPLVAACLAKEPDDRPELGSVLAELAGTALPRGDEDPTEWLPEAVATRVLRTTAAATQVVPTLAVTSEVVPEEPHREGPAPEETAPEESSAAEPAPEPVPAEAPPAETAPAPAEPGSAAPGTAPAPRQAHRSGSSRAAGTRTLWGLLAAAAAAVVVLSLVVDSTDGTTLGTGAPADTPDASTPSPAASPPASTSEDSSPSVRTSKIRDITFLGGSGRFATLSTSGVHLFEADEGEAVERITESHESFVFSYSQLATTPDGSVLASKAVKSANDGVAAIHVWDLDASERHVVELPDAGDGGHFALSPDGETVYFGDNTSGEAAVSAYRTATGEELYSVDVPAEPRPGSVSDRPWQGAVTGVGTTPDGELLVAVLDTGLAVWDAASGQPHPSYPELRQWTGEITGPAVISDGAVVTASADSVLYWDIRSDAEPLELPLPSEVRDTRARPAEVALGDGGSRVVASGHDTDREGSFLVVWDTEGEVLAEGDPEQEYVSVTASPDDDRLLTAFYPLDQSGAEVLTFLDRDLGPSEEFRVPAR